jgi:hypothetical protein
MKNLAFIAGLLFATAAVAHGPSKGVNGGPQVDAGDYHVELVANDKTLSIYLNDRDNKPVNAQGYKGIGIFVVKDKPHRIELQPEQANKLTGTAPVSLPASAKGAVQITLPSGKTVQAKFE